MNIKRFWRVMLSIALATTTLAVASCKEENQQNDPIDATVETPRYMAAEGDNIYFTSYFPTAVIRYDIEQHAITGVCKLGLFHPEGIAAVDGKLYIASSNISDENNTYHYDNKLYIVDIADFKVVDSVTVGYNPAKVIKLDNSHIVFNTWGDYESDQGGLYIMNTQNKEITPLSITLYNFDVYNGDIYGYTSPYSNMAFYKIDGATHQATQIITSWSATDHAYSFNLNPYNGDIIVTTDGNFVSNGDCYLFSNDGTKKKGPIQLGKLPSKAVAIDADRVLVLNEGSWGENSAEVSKLDFSNDSYNVQFFSQKNSRGLGDVAQDIILYKGNAYITVSFSNSIETMDPETGLSTRFATAK